MRNHCTRVYSGMQVRSETLTAPDRILIGESGAIAGGGAGDGDLPDGGPADLIYPAERTRPERSNRTKTIGRMPP
jgi:hypothetical protein